MNNMKKFFSLLLTAILCFSLAFSLISCGDDPDNNDNDDSKDNKITYTVTVKDEDGNSVSGVNLMISDGTSIFQNKTTDTSGKASLQLDAENASLGVMITSVPTGYVKPSSIAGSVFNAVFGNNKDITVTITRPVTETVTYTVKVVDQNGDAVEGVELQICHTVCVQCSLTDANGETSKELPESVASMTLKVGILDVPAGYTIPTATIDGSYHETIEPGETTVTVVITKN